MGLIYTVQRNNVAISTTADFLALQAGLARAFRILEITIGGLGTASAANTLGIYRPTTLGVTSSVPVVPERQHPALPAPAFTATTAWATQPTLGAPLLLIPANANGGAFRWVAQQGQQLEVQGQPAANTIASALSFRAALGSSPISFHVVIEEF